MTDSRIRVNVEIPIVRPDGTETIKCYAENEPRLETRTIERTVRRCMKRIVREINKDLKTP